MPYLDKIRINGVDYDLMEDTGWVDMTVNTTNARLVSENTKPQVRRIGKVMYFRGQINTISTGIELPLVVPPEGFEPPFSCCLIGAPQAGQIYYKSSLNAFVFYNLTSNVNNVRLEGQCLID